MRTPHRKTSDLESNPQPSQPRTVLYEFLTRDSTKIWSLIFLLMSDPEEHSPPLPGLPWPQAGLRHCDLGSHPAGHQLHCHAFSTAGSGRHFSLLQVRSTCLKSLRPIRSTCSGPKVVWSHSRLTFSPRHNLCVSVKFLETWLKMCSRGYQTSKWVCPSELNLLELVIHTLKSQKPENGFQNSKCQFAQFKTCCMAFSLRQLIRAVRMDYCWILLEVFHLNI